MIEISEVKRLKDECGLSFREISNRTGLARKTVSKWYYSKDYPEYSRQKETSPKKDLIIPYLKLWINEDIKHIKKGQRKKIRPASTMWHQLKELGIKVSESTVRTYTRELKPKEAFIPLDYEPGIDMQVDWGEIKIAFSENRFMKVYLFVASLPFSNARFVYPYFKNDWLCFADGHKRAFDFFGGIPKRITYDNLSSAVKKVLSGINREEQDRMLYLKSFYGFETNYCAVAKGNEKGSVESSVGFFKRRFLGSHQEFKDFDCLKEHLANACITQLDTKHYRKKSQTIFDLLTQEQEKLSPLPEQEFESSLILSLKSNKSSMISYDGVSYSIPSDYCQKELSVKVRAFDLIFVNAKNEEIARHKRSHKALATEVYNFRHYLPVLLKKSRAFDKARCIKQSDFPKSFWDYLNGLQKHQKNGNREMVRILMLEKDYRLKDIFFAMDWGIEHKTFSYDSLKLTLKEMSKEMRPVELVRKKYPKITEHDFNLSKYDELLGVS